MLTNHFSTSYNISGSSSQDADSDEEWPDLGTAGAADMDAECDHEVVVDPNDEKAIEMFMNKNPPVRQVTPQVLLKLQQDDGGAALTCVLFCDSCRRTLADIIMEKITEKQTEVGTLMSEVSGCPMPQLDPRVTEVYRGVSKVSCSNMCAHKHAQVTQHVLFKCERQIKSFFFFLFLF